MTILLSIVGIAFAFGAVIFFHEFGHFIVAKRSGVKVERFSFGLGPEMIGFKWGETRYCIAWLPLGGEVRMAGEMVEGGDEPPKVGPNAEPVDPARTFFAQPWYRRFAIALAGPFMNYVLAIIIFFGLFMIWGEPVQTNGTEVGKVLVGMPAEAAGFRPGDRILRIDGKDVKDFSEVAKGIESRAGFPTDIVVRRGEETLTLSATPDPKRRVIGIGPAEPAIERHKVGAATALGKSVQQCWHISTFTLYYLGQKIISHERPDVAGPLGIGQVIVKAIKEGPENFFNLIALMSVAIGLFNLFPIPMLDGGHMLYYAIEAIRGRPVSQNVMARANMVGMALLLSLLVFATFNDVQRMRVPSEKTSPTATSK